MDAQKLAQDIQNHNLHEMQKTADKAYEALVGNPIKGRISEQDFVTYFLPYFSGNTQSVSNKDRNVIAEWIGIAGTTTAEVDVIGPSGEVLYTVPALFDTNIIGLQQAYNTKPIDQIMTEYNQVKASVPRAAIQTVNEQLATKYSNLGNEPVSNDIVSQRWISIMGRYGVALPEQQETASAVSKSSSEDDVTYD